MKNKNNKLTDLNGNIYISGKPGTGKTSLMINMMLEKIDKNESFICIDTKGDISEKILSRFNKDKIDDLCYIDFGNTEYIYGLSLMNIGNIKDLEDRELDVNNLIQFFIDIYGEEQISPIIQEIFYNIIMALSERYEGLSPFYVSRMLFDDAFRQSVTRNLQNSIVSARWEHIVTKFSDGIIEQVKSILESKIAPFMQGQLGRIFNIPESGHFEDIIREKKFIIIRAKKSELGISESGLLSSVILSKIYRHLLINETSNPLTIFLDEGQQFLSKTLINLFDISYEKNLQIVFAHKNLSQLQNKGIGSYMYILSMIINNSNNHILFKQTPIDAKIYGDTIYPDIIKQKKISELNDRECFLLNSDKNIAELVTLPLYDLNPKNSEEKKLIIKQINNLKFGIARSIVDQEVFYKAYV